MSLKTGVTRQAANLMTGLRIVCSVMLLCFHADSVGFTLLYLLCGLSDMLDGIIARKMNCASALGSKLDTAADMIFASAAAIKLLPVMQFPQWMLLWCAGIAAVKLFALLTGFVMHRRFMAMHTLPNKLVGLMLFAVPLIRYDLYAALVCCAASAAAIHEYICIRKRPDL